LSYLSANLSPGELVTIFGANFSEPGIYTPVSLPLPTQLDGVSVTVNGIPAPILAVANVTGQEQINLQVPYDFSQTAPGEEAVPMVVNTTLYGNSLPTYAQCSLASQGGTIGAGADPGIATTDGTNGAIQHGADYSLVTSANPAEPGEVLVLYAVGLGAVTPAVASGAAAPASPVSRTQIPTSVTVGGVAATVLFSGLTPGYVGPYQINFQLASKTPAGDDDLIVTSGSGTSLRAGNTVKLEVGN
jgi:uncharacterized protein (TIGR03437 family)